MSTSHPKEPDVTPDQGTHAQERETMTRTTALGLHALAHDIATGTRPPGIRWYSPPAGTRLFPVPILPAPIHDALCGATAVNLDDPAEHLHICDECKLAVEDAA